MAEDIIFGWRVCWIWQLRSSLQEPAGLSSTVAFGQSEAVEPVWMVTCQILPWLFLVNCKGFHGKKLTLPALQMGFIDLSIFFLNGWQKRANSIFWQFDPALSSLRHWGWRGQILPLVKIGKKYFWLNSWLFCDASCRWGKLPALTQKVCTKFC